MKWMKNLLEKYFTRQGKKSSEVEVISDDDTIPDEYVCGLMYWLKDDGSCFITFVCDEGQEDTLARLTHQLNTGNLYPETIQFIKNAFIKDDNQISAIKFLASIQKYLPTSMPSEGKPVVRPSRVFGSKEEQ